MASPAGADFEPLTESDFAAAPNQHNKEQTLTNAPTQATAHGVDPSGNEKRQVRKPIKSAMKTSGRFKGLKNKHNN